VKDWGEVLARLPNEDHADLLSTQSARCMDCGTPFCHQTATGALPPAAPPCCCQPTLCCSGARLVLISCISNVDPGESNICMPSVPHTWVHTSLRHQSW
jgi:hypothetical protein